MIKLGHSVEFDGRMWVVTEFCEEPNTGLAVLTPRPAFLSESSYALPNARIVPSALLDLVEAWKRSDESHADRAAECKNHISALESALAERERECERLRGLLREWLPENSQSIPIESLQDHNDDWYNRVRAALAAGKE